LKIDGGVNQVPVQKYVQPKQAEHTENKVAERAPKENAVSGDTGSSIDITA